MPPCGQKSAVTLSRQAGAKTLSERHYRLRGLFYAWATQHKFVCLEAAQFLNNLAATSADIAQHYTMASTANQNCFASALASSHTGSTAAEGCTASVSHFHAGTSP